MLSLGVISTTNLRGHSGGRAPAHLRPECSRACGLCLGVLFKWLQASSAQWRRQCHRPRYELCKGEIRPVVRPSCVLTGAAAYCCTVLSVCRFSRVSPCTTRCRRIARTSHWQIRSHCDGRVGTSCGRPCLLSFEAKIPRKRAPRDGVRSRLRPNSAHTVMHLVRVAALAGVWRHRQHVTTSCLCAWQEQLLPWRRLLYYVIAIAEHCRALRRWLQRLGRCEALLHLLFASGAMMCALTTNRAHGKRRTVAR
jgi:hypothetical protein